MDCILRFSIKIIFSFLAKHNKQLGTVFIRRDSSRHARQVVGQMADVLNSESICIFPEGGVPDDESVVLDSFKDGAFRLAIDHQLPIVPITFGDNKKDGVQQGI